MLIQVLVRLTVYADQAIVRQPDAGENKPGIDNTVSDAAGCGPTIDNTVSDAAGCGPTIDNTVSDAAGCGPTIDNTVGIMMKYRLYGKPILLLRDQLSPA